MSENETVSYTIRDIESTTWRKLRHMALDKDISIRELLIQLIEKATAK